MGVGELIQVEGVVEQVDPVVVPAAVVVEMFLEREE